MRNKEIEIKVTYTKPQFRRKKKKEKKENLYEGNSNSRIHGQVEA